MKIPPNFDTKIGRGCILLDFWGRGVQNGCFLTQRGANADFEQFLRLVFVRIKRRFVLFQHLLLAQMQFLFIDDSTGMHHLEHNDSVHILELSFGLFGSHPRQWLLDIHESTSFKILALRLGLIKMLKNSEKSSSRNTKLPRLL